MQLKATVTGNPAAGATTGGNLQKSDFAVRDAAPKDALTALTWHDSETHRIVPVTISYDGKYDAECRMVITAAQFLARFDAANSYAIRGKLTDDLLKHGNLHLIISEAIALRAGANCVGMMGKGVAHSDASKSGAQQNAEALALTQLNGLYQAFKANWRQITIAISDRYDDETQSGSLAGPQADWRDNWPAKVAEALRLNGWTR